eukprot:365447-Chlamydomonas_euryale.AAC.22
MPCTSDGPAHRPCHRIIAWRQRRSSTHLHTHALHPHPCHTCTHANICLVPIPVPSPQAYDAMPIEEFGLAMMRGMGWSEGMGVGRNRKVVDAIEYLKVCGQRCGLEVWAGTSPVSCLRWHRQNGQQGVWVPAGVGSDSGLRTTPTDLPP